MNIEELREFCLSLKHTQEKLPFDDKTLVFTVLDKIFCLTDINNFHRINIKCDPYKAILLREEYQSVIPAYHMNKKHWNSIIMDNSIKEETIKLWIVESYTLVVSKLTKKQQAFIKDNN